MGFVSFKNGSTSILTMLRKRYPLAILMKVYRNHSLVEAFCRGKLVGRLNYDNIDY